MFNVCSNCGEYRPDKLIDPSGPYAICPICSHKHLFLRLPLLLVGGASGSGKSTVLHALVTKIPEAVLLDSDILWRPEFNQPDNKYQNFFETWLRVCKNISQSGKPVVLFGAGFAVPENLENCVERRYFSRLHYLAFVCQDEILVERLQARPGWRKSAEPAFMDQQLAFNRWFKDQSNRFSPPLELIDTSSLPVEETSRQAAEWIKSHADKFL
jgi:predicted kinase